MLSFITNNDRGDSVEVYSQRTKDLLGEIYQGKDGCYFFWAKPIKYTYSCEELLMVTQKIEELDAEWAYFINNQLDQSRDDGYSRIDLIGQNGNDGLHYEEVCDYSVSGGC